MNTTKYTLLIPLIALFCSTSNLFAGDRDFTYTYQSFVEPKNHRELELWFTYLQTGDELSFTSLSHRAEFEIGLGHKLQTSLYLNLDYASFINDQFAVIDPQTGLATSSNYLQKDFSMSVSSEWKWQITDPVANAIGTALYGEFTLGPDVRGIEGKLIFDKKVGNLIAALNVVGELETTSELESTYFAEGVVVNNVLWKKEKVLELNLGLAYDFSEAFSAGIELFNASEFEDGEMENALYGGPSLSYKGEEWWATLTAMPLLMAGEQGELNYRPLETRLILAFDL